MKNQQNQFVRINHNIRVPKVRVIHNNKNLGILSTDDAKTLASKEGLDLVEISPEAMPPVCKIMDFGKYKYELQRKKKEQKHNEVKIKEVRFKPSISEHDLNVKAAHAMEFLNKGMKVQLTVFFEKRQIVHKDLGFDIMTKFVAELLKNENCFVEQQPRLEGGKEIHCRIDVKNRERPAQ